MVKWLRITHALDLICFNDGDKNRYVLKSKHFGRKCNKLKLFFNIACFVVRKIAACWRD